MTAKEAAAYLEVHYRTFLEYLKIPVSKGGPPRKKIPGTHLLKIPRIKFIKWADAETGD